MPGENHPVEDLTAPNLPLQDQEQYWENVAEWEEEMRRYDESAKIKSLKVQNG